MKLNENQIKGIIKIIKVASKASIKVNKEIDVNVINKKDTSPVTIADYCVQAIVCKYLNDRFPSIPIIGEESSSYLRKEENKETLTEIKTLYNEVLDSNIDDKEILDYIDFGSVTKESSDFWCLDPIDGTKGFIRKEQYSICLALIIQNKVEFSIISCPNLQNYKGEDHASGYLLVNEAGGKVSDIHGKDLMFFGPKLRKNKGILASNGKVHDSVIKAIKKLNI